MEAKQYPRLVVIGLASEALLALTRARLILHHTRPDDIMQRNIHVRRKAEAAGRPLPETMIRESCEQIAFVIPRLAMRLPWRADCLVQALAGQQMLMRRRIASEIRVGAAKHPLGTFEAHAWLSCGDSIVLGGDVARFEPLLGSSGNPSEGSPGST